MPQFIVRQAYFSPSQVSVYVGDTWIDDAAGIQYEVRDEKIPVYGYADQYPKAFMRSRTLVTGVLYINFRFKNYLAEAIDKVSPPSAGFSKYREQQDRAFQKFFDANNLTVQEEDIKSFGGLLAKSIASRFIPPSVAGVARDFRAIKNALTTKFWAKPQSPQPYPGQRTTESQLQHGITNTRAGNLPTTGMIGTASRINLVIIYGDEENAERPAYFRTITDVQFSGESQEISSIGGAGDQVILEVYPFLASEVV